MNIPIIKFVLAALSLLMSNATTILKTSIIPIALMLPMVFSMPALVEAIQQEQIDTNQISPMVLVYGLLFIYGYSILHINLYRLIILGEQSMFQYGLAPITTSIKFIAMSLLIMMFNTAPLVLQMPLLEPLIFLLIAHLMLNLANIAAYGKFKQWPVSFIDRISIALLQFVIPGFLLILAGYISGILLVIVKLFLIYWGAINLGLIFNQLQNTNNGS